MGKAFLKFFFLSPTLLVLLYALRQHGTYRRQGQGGQGSDKDLCEIQIINFKFFK